MRLLVLSCLAILGGCTAVLLGSGNERPPAERRADGSAADARTTAAVRARLDAEPGLSQQGIGVTTDNGRVTLTGSVRSYTERNLAGQIARGVKGVASVDNRIRVHVD